MKALVTGLAAAAAMIIAGSPSHAAPDDGAEITAPGPQGKLHGSYIAPRDAMPIVLLIPGSGHVDRDGNSPPVVKSATMKLIAQGLAQRGIGSVRIDKRGMFASAGAIADANAVTFDDYAADVGSWVATLRQQTGRPCIWLAGHSEGGVVALVATGRVEGICGVILLSTPGRPMGQLILEQLANMPSAAALMPDAQHAVAALEQGETVDVSGFHPALQSLFAPQIQTYLIAAFRTDPAALAATAQVPLLVIQGDSDLQVTPVDAQALHQAQPAATLVMLPGVNHVLKIPDDASRGANLATYATPDLPLAPGVVPAMADFILSHTEG
ncbi:MAG: alpha/beta fold hydrolase [Sphingomonadales bacterium]|nr:alpha/beta fold hydrolase [Sphingomonadales bacterium]MBD3775148.1 alpha/beta fold hydrolase [Paracoccaceae bacterium]